MKAFVVGINSVVGGALLTLVLVVGSWLALMFSTGAESTRKEGLFGAVYFESVASSGGGLSASMGIGSAVALGGVFLIAALMVLLVQLIFLRLRAYKQTLLSQQDGAVVATQR